MTTASADIRPRLQYRDGLRGWLEEVQRIGELLHVKGANWDVEMGSITQMLTENSKNTAPAILFDEVPGYPKGFRTLYGHFSTVKRVALTLGLPLVQERKVDIVKQFHARMQEMKAIPPRIVNDGPILQNVMQGDDCDVLKFPVPRHHEKDTARFIGTADCVVTQDPDKGWFNLGAYRSQVYDGKTVGLSNNRRQTRSHPSGYLLRTWTADESRYSVRTGSAVVFAFWCADARRQ